ncbi:hypothetical protein FACS1894120_5150 [Clostridia bacterium]|nr:hypothetical protein FACS1894120_5150 [Clostridia bacterium]
MNEIITTLPEKEEQPLKKYDSFIFFRSYLKGMEEFSELDDLVRFFFVVLRYGLDNEVPGKNSYDWERAVLETVKPVIDKNRERYAAQVERRREQDRAKQKWTANEKYINELCGDRWKKTEVKRIIAVLEDNHIDDKHGSRKSVIAFEYEKFKAQEASGKVYDPISYFCTMLESHYKQQERKL